MYNELVKKAIKNDRSSVREVLKSANEDKENNQTQNQLNWVNIMDVNVIDVIWYCIEYWIRSIPWQVKIDNRPKDMIKSFLSKYYWPWTSRNKKIVENTRRFYSVEKRINSRVLLIFTLLGQDEIYLFLISWDSWDAREIYLSSE